MITSNELIRFDQFNSEEWMNPSEAALYLRILGKDGQPSVHSIRNLVNKGRLPFYKPLGRLLFKKSELQKFIESSRNRGVNNGYK